MLKFDLVNFVCVIIDLLILYFLMKKFVFGRVTKIIDARQAMIEKGQADVAKAQKEADDLKAEYEKSLENANETSAQIVKEAKVKAREEYAKILDKAVEDAEAVKANAKKAMAAEREQQMDDMHAEIMNLAVSAAGKIMAGQVSAETDAALYDAFLNEAGDGEDGKDE